MKLKLLIIFIVSTAFTHKFYLSVSDVEYNEETQSLQLITRLFYDDLEAVLKERYDDTIVVDETQDQNVLNGYITKYLQRKLKVKVNGESLIFEFIGKEYEAVSYTHLTLPTIYSV